MIQRKELVKLQGLVRDRDRAAVLARAYCLATLRSDERHRRGLRHCNPFDNPGYVEFACSAWGTELACALLNNQGSDPWLVFGCASARASFTGNGVLPSGR